MRLVILLAALALCAACQPSSSQDAPAGGAACPDDGPRLPETGICAGRGYAYLDSGAAPDEAAPPGCAWTVNETMLPGDEALLYRAAVCNGVTTKLAYAGGAHSASIAYETSATGVGEKGREMIKLFGTDPDPQGALKQAIADLPAAERQACEIQPAGLAQWPADALVIGLTKAARAKRPKDEPIAMCGPLGKDEDSIRYWRIRQGFAWFFDLGQEQLDFDAASMTVIRKGADGSWSIKE